MIKRVDAPISLSKRRKLEAGALVHSYDGEEPYSVVVAIFERPKSACSELEPVCGSRSLNLLTFLCIVCEKDTF